MLTKRFTRRCPSCDVKISSTTSGVEHHVLRILRFMHYIIRNAQFLIFIISSVMSTSRCPSCCGRCSEIIPQTIHLLLDNMPPFGIIFVDLHVEQQHVICSHRHVQDGWHKFRAPRVMKKLSDPQEVEICERLGFLVDNGFINATYRAIGRTMAVRIYLDPRKFRHEVRPKLNNRGYAVS